MFDYYFHYNYVLRFLLILKYGNYKYLNTYNLVQLNKIITDFTIKDLDDLNHLRLSNYFYFFSFFLGKRGVITKVKSNFDLNVLYHSFSIRLIHCKYDLNFALFFLAEGVFPRLNTNYLHWIRSTNFYIFEVADMNIFVDKKASIGFLNLIDSLNFKFYFTGFDLNSDYSGLLMTSIEILL